MFSLNYLTSFLRSDVKPCSQQMPPQTVFKIEQINDFASDSSIPWSQCSDGSIVDYKDALYIFGGSMNTYRDYLMNDLIRVDVKLGSWSREDTNGIRPAQRRRHSAVVYKSSMFIFGGDNKYCQADNDLFEYQFNTRLWTKLESTDCDVPSPRHSHCAAVYDEHLWIFGGFNDNLYRDLRDMWRIRLNAGENKWEKVLLQGEWKPQFLDFNCTVAVGRDKMFVLDGERNELFSFSFKQNAWSPITNMPAMSPKTREKPTAIMITPDDQLIVMHSVKILHCYDLNSQIWSIIPAALDSEVPPTLQHIASTNNMINYRIVFFKDAMFILSGYFRGFYETNLCKLQLKLNYSKCTLHEDYGQLLKTRLCSDVVFVVGPKEIKTAAHIAIVAARSNWLRDRIRKALASQQKSGPCKNLPKLQVKISNAIPEVFKMILNYIYTDRVDPPTSHSLLPYLDLYNLAVQMDLKHLVQMIRKNLAQQYLNLITVSNFVDILSKAHNVGLLDGKEYCLRFIADETNYVNVIESKEFETLDNGLIMEVVRRKERPSDSQNSPMNESLDCNHSTFTQDMEKLLNEIGQEFSDITLLVEGYSIPAHKCILAARSSYFKGMVRSLLPPDNTVRIQIGAMIPSKEAFDALLKYIYYDDMNILIEHSLTLFAAPDFYGFSNNRLQEIIIANLEDKGTIDHMVQMLERAHLSQQIDLKTYLLGLIVRRCPNISNWPRTPNLPHELWLDIIDTFVASYTRSLKN